MRGANRRRITAPTQPGALLPDLDQVRALLRGLDQVRALLLKYSLEIYCYNLNKTLPGVALSTANTDYSSGVSGPSRAASIPDTQLYGSGTDVSTRMSTLTRAQQGESDEEGSGTDYSTVVSGAAKTNISD